MQPILNLFRKRIKRNCATCGHLPNPACIQERMVASHSMKPFPKDADELRLRYVCSDWEKRA